MTSLCRILIVCLLMAPAAHASLWEVDTKHSNLSFYGTQAGEEFRGEFKKFTCRIAFDPIHPESGKIDVTVAIDSATIDDADKQAALPTDDWFATKKFPTAEFHSTTIRAVSQHSKALTFEANGTLSLRGISKPITLQFQLTDKGEGVYEATGETTLQRNAFGIGRGGEWATDKWIAYPVRVAFTLRAKRP